MRIKSPKRRASEDEPDVYSDPDDFFQANASLGTGSAGFTEYSEKDAGEPVPKPKKADRIRLGFQSPAQAYED